MPCVEGDAQNLPSGAILGATVCKEGTKFKEHQEEGSRVFHLWESGKSSGLLPGTSDWARGGGRE